MNNKKGITIVELLLSVVLISLVLIFIMQLCLRARNAYLNNSINVKYELSKSIIIDAVMSDYFEKGISSIDSTDTSITFNFADTDNTSKTLSIITGEITGDSYIIKYGEGSSAVGRRYLKSEIKIPDNGEWIESYSRENNINRLTEFKIKLEGTDGYDYSINIYCPQQISE